MNKKLLKSLLTLVLTAGVIANVSLTVFAGTDPGDEPRPIAPIGSVIPMGADPGDEPRP